MLNRITAKDDTNHSDVTGTDAPDAFGSHNVRSPAENQQTVGPQPPIVQTEALQSLVEECRRLKAENANIKQLYDESQSAGKGPTGNAVAPLQHTKRRYVIITIIALLVGILVGYISFSQEY